MADLIIKSSPSNNLVIQGGDNSPAITVGNTGLTTFAEAATLSGGVAGNTTFSGNTTLSGTANNLGTATAGTIGDEVNFPDKHVLQFKLAAVTTASETPLTTTNSALNIFSGTPSITPYKTGSRIIAMITVPGIASMTSTASTIKIQATDGTNGIKTLCTHLTYQTQAGSAEPGRWVASFTTELGNGTTRGTSFPVNVQFFNNDGTGDVRVCADDDIAYLWLLEVEE